MIVLIKSPFFSYFFYLFSVSGVCTFIVSRWQSSFTPNCLSRSMPEIKSMPCITFGFWHDLCTHTVSFVPLCLTFFGNMTLQLPQFLCSNNVPSHSESTKRLWSLAIFLCSGHLAFSVFLTKGFFHFPLFFLAKQNGAPMTTVNTFQ